RRRALRPHPPRGRRRRARDAWVREAERPWGGLNRPAAARQACCGPHGRAGASPQRGFWTLTVGTATTSFLCPTLTLAAFTSNAGAAPPFTSIFGSSAVRVWLTLI